MEYKILPDINNLITNWVCQGLEFDTRWLKNYQTFGFSQNNKMVGGLIFHDIRIGQDVWWTIYSTDKRWCNRRMLRQMFSFAFSRLKCKRINILVNKDNQNCLKLVTKLGFKKEGLLRSFRENGEDCYILGILKTECKWITTGEKYE